MLPQVASMQRADATMSTTRSVALNTSTTAGTIGLFQVFDQFASNTITTSQASTDGWRYGAVWGSRPGMAPFWQTSNTAITPFYYMPQETDANTGAWGSIGHPLSWWVANHPSWVLYACTSAGTPTKTPAYFAELPDNVPLDIHNPDVVSYQVNLAASFAISQGYSGVGFDEVLFENETGTEAAATDYGCGIYENGTFVRRYTGRDDPAWTADTLAWVKTAHAMLQAKNLKLAVNHPAANISSPNEQSLLENVDADVDEAGFSDYGNYKLELASGLAVVTVNWMIFAQNHGAVPLIIDKFYQTTPITPLQLEYSVATYLLGNDSAARLFVGNKYGYGAEQYHGEYTTNYGKPCTTYYGGAKYNASNPNIYYREFTNAIVVVNTGSLPRASELAYLPKGLTYTDLEGRTVTNPLTVDSNDAYVLLTTGYGCT